MAPLKPVNKCTKKPPCGGGGGMMTRNAAAKRKANFPPIKDKENNVEMSRKEEGEDEKATVKREKFNESSDVDEHCSPNVSLVRHQLEDQLNLHQRNVPPNGVRDFDGENFNDPNQFAEYAMDVFDYLKNKEQHFQITDYIPHQPYFSQRIRAVLINWLVELQENLQLTHETLYLTVKLVDLYLSRIIVDIKTLQLLGITAMFAASKYEEVKPPVSGDFLYTCNGAYTKRQLVLMEIKLLKVCGCDLGVPLSYTFLRRYARCGGIAMPVLTLARYILETSLLDYESIGRTGSKMAAAALYIALKMCHLEAWNGTFEYYSGWKLDDFKCEIVLLNTLINRKPSKGLMSVWNKYESEVFFKVASVPTILNDDLF